MRNLFFLLIYSIYVFGNGKTKEDLEQLGQEKLEDCVENFGLGIVETGVGVIQFSKGDPIGGAVGIGTGINSFKDSFDNFKEARDAFEKSRKLDDDHE